MLRPLQRTTNLTQQLTDTKPRLQKNLIKKNDKIYRDLCRSHRPSACKSRSIHYYQVIFAVNCLALSTLEDFAVTPSKEAIALLS